MPSAPPIGCSDPEAMWSRPEARTRRLIKLVVPACVDELVGRRDTTGLVTIGGFSSRSAAWEALLRRALAVPEDDQ